MVKLTSVFCSSFKETYVCRIDRIIVLLASVRQLQGFLNVCPLKGKPTGTPISSCNLPCMVFILTNQVDGPQLLRIAVVPDAYGYF